MLMDFYNWACSDNTLRVWDVEDGRCIRILGDGELGSGGGHTSRIWDVTSSSSGDFVASASGDSTVKVQMLSCILWNRI